MTATSPPAARTTAGARPTQLPTPGAPVAADEAEAVGTVDSGESVGIPSLAGVLRGISAAFAQPGPVTRGAGRLVRDWATIARGSDEHRPSPKDNRFADPAWADNPVFRRLAQGYLALSDQLQRLVDEYETGASDWHDVGRARFAVG